MTPCATIENCRDNKHQYLCIFMSAPASCSDSNSFPLPKAGKNPSIWILSCIWVTTMWIACLLAKGFCPLPAEKPKEILIHMETWQNGIPSKLHPFVADTTLGYVTRGVCWLLSFRSWEVLPPAQSAWKLAVAHFINSSTAVQLRNRYDLVMQAWEWWHSYDSVWKAQSSFVKMNEQGTLPAVPTTCE